MEYNTSMRSAREAIKKAMIGLLSEKSFENISIKEISEKAGVHRSTFYAYYACKHDVLVEIEQDIVDNLPEFKTPIPEEELVGAFTSFVEYLKAHQDILRAIHMRGLAPGFTESLISGIMKRYFFKADDAELTEAVYIFCISGIQGVIYDWIEKGCTISIDRIAEISVKLAFNTVGLRTDFTLG